MAGFGHTRSRSVGEKSQKNQRIRWFILQGSRNFRGTWPSCKAMDGDPHRVGVEFQNPVNEYGGADPGGNLSRRLRLASVHLRECHGPAAARCGATVTAGQGRGYAMPFPSPRAGRKGPAFPHAFFLRLVHNGQSAGRKSPDPGTPTGACGGVLQQPCGIGGAAGRAAGTLSVRHAAPARHPFERGVARFARCVVLLRPCPPAAKCMAQRHFVQQRQPCKGEDLDEQS